MTMIYIHAGAARRHPSSIARALLDRLAKAAKRRRIRKEMKELSRLPRHLLRDMGLEQYASPDVPTFPNHWR
ncbi:uncharacterized protein Ga0609869_000879 [Rhodovulum iodosum]|uniref:DUF1127 domain-containing protein n=1 Tax=Rhodovulum iodosum TaxID=68291 RepID=A0ABV3XQD2_9RHOB|nr:hypothetical protein [Rhodovulum robiginosum]RSK39400.1 hypothetical protein EJA01_01085 [Rhodovulum robiginosum]